MDRFVLLLHLLGAIGMGFYLLLPFLVMRMQGMTAGGKAGLAGGLAAANRWGQILLLVQLLTGVFLAARDGVSTPWIVVVIVVLVLIGAVTGMLGKPLRQLRTENQTAAAVQEQLRKVQLFGWIAFALFLVMILLMYYPEWL